MIFNIVLAFSPISLLASENDKTNIDSMYTKGRQYFERGDLAQAAEIFESIIKIDPANNTAYKSLSDCYKYMGIDDYLKSFYQEAIDNWNKVLDLYPGDKEIQGYIRRCQSEQEAMGALRGDSAIAIIPPPQVDTAIIKIIDTVFLTPNEIIDTVVIVKIDSSIIINHHNSHWGFSSGPAFGIGEPDISVTGITVEGNYSVILENHWLGTKLSGAYTRFYEDEDNINSSPLHLSVFKLSFSGLAGIKVANSSSILVSAGLGGYEVIYTTSAENDDTALTRRTSVMGITLGLDWQIHLKSANLNLAVEYDYIFGHYTPNLLRILIGFSS